MNMDTFENLNETFLMLIDIFSKVWASLPAEHSNWIYNCGKPFNLYSCHHDLPKKITTNRVTEVGNTDFESFCHLTSKNRNTIRL